ncbi:MAG: DNA polymerase III subunit gamma/tau [Tissierellia bacterium]|nr:DNA polymerase III subunit gamma/tau [Tissierellia bacterium]
MYKALYRKYRPKTFDEVIGQEHITQVLKNQLKTNSISHAYLFSGTRGTGKTSCAKILARAVNCESDGDKPCNICPSCLESLEDSAIDIIEMDGASNSGVDHIRNLKDRAFYQPTSLKYKVYIIDEIHMLTREAFNALLKILEEPPAHLIFILATTEQERIPLTILSRCQKFQFRRISSKEIKSSLQLISDIEGITLDDKTYNLIINNSDGSMRDAQSIMEQLVSSGEKNIEYNFASNILGVVSTDILFQLADTISNDNPGEMLEILDETISSGKDIEQLGKDILNHFRSLMLAKVSSDSLSRLIHTNEEQYIKQSKKFTLENILLYMEKIINQLGEIKYSQQKRTLLEIAMLEILNINNNFIEIKKEKEFSKSSSKTSSYEKIVDREDKLPKKNIEDITDKINRPVIKTEEEIKKDLNQDYNKGNKEVLDLKRIKNDWNEILAEVRNSPRKLLHAYIIEASLMDYKDRKIILGFSKEYEFHKNNLMKIENREFLENVVSMFYNMDIKIDSIFTDDQSYNAIDKDIETLSKLVGEENIKIL